MPPYFPCMSNQSESAGLGGRLRRYAKVSGAVGGLAARLAPAAAALAAAAKARACTSMPWVPSDKIQAAGRALIAASSHGSFRKTIFRVARCRYPVHKCKKVTEMRKIVLNFSQYLTFPAREARHAPR
ncbi:MAG: hypothetical protein VXY90_01615 [Pseudomonadota bacterium]|nr:hypothetical protein [Pseudomonadota bacterium]